MSKFLIILFIALLFFIFSFIIWNYNIVLGIMLILVITVCIIQSVKQCNQKILEDPTEVICISTIYSRQSHPVTSSTISYYNHCISNTTYTSCTIMSTSTILTFSFPTQITSTIPITLTIPITPIKS